MTRVGRAGVALPLFCLATGCSVPAPAIDSGPAEEEATPTEQVVTACQSNASIPTDALSGTGIDVGDTAYNFDLIDQHGERVSLYDFHGCVVVLDLVTQWCGPCKEAAPSLEVIHQEMAPDVVVVAVLLETLDGEPPAREHAQWWAESFDLTHPVLADTYASQYNYTGGSFPTVVVLDREMMIVNADWDHEDVEFLRGLLD